MWSSMWKYLYFIETCLRCSQEAENNEVKLIQILTFIFLQNLYLKIDIREVTKFSNTNK